MIIRISRSLMWTEPFKMASSCGDDLCPVKDSPIDDYDDDDV